ncbi:hypothetical protein EDC04DRAFT_2692569 [Pisolithus marmoratus]|nr:hypothetical protein EDC04DRAFT_2692569 [Pisolithus marmoratus]
MPIHLGVSILVCLSCVAKPRPTTFTSLTVSYHVLNIELSPARTTCNIIITFAHCYSVPVVSKCQECRFSFETLI